MPPVGNANFAWVQHFLFHLRTKRHGHVLTPGRYVGIAPQEDDGEPFEEKMARLVAEWGEQQAEARRVDADIEVNLARLGFGEKV